MGAPGSASRAAKGAAALDDYAMVYSFTGRPFELGLRAISGESQRARWYSPRDGSAQTAGVVANSGTRRFAPPGQPADGHDWMLVVDDAAKRFGPPGQ